MWVCKIKSPENSAGLAQTESDPPDETAPDDQLHARPRHDRRRPVASPRGAAEPPASPGPDLYDAAKAESFGHAASQLMALPCIPYSQGTSPLTPPGYCSVDMGLQWPDSPTAEQVVHVLDAGGDADQVIREAARRSDLRCGHTCRVSPTRL